MTITWTPSDLQRHNEELVVLGIENFRVILMCHNTLLYVV